MRVRGVFSNFKTSLHWDKVRRHKNDFRCVIISLVPERILETIKVSLNPVIGLLGLFVDSSLRGNNFTLKSE